MLNIASRLITYGASDSSDLGRRQLAFASVYNLTLTLSTFSGTTYTITANARQAPNGASEPNCFVILCVNDGCGTQAALTAEYQLYSYTFTANADEEAFAALSFSCSGPAYVGVDNVAAVAVGSGNQPSENGLTRTITSYATTTQLVTPSINGSQGQPPTITTTVVSTLIVPSSYAVFHNFTNSEYYTAERTFTAPGQNLTTDRISTVYSTAVHTTTAPASSVLLTTTGKQHSGIPQDRALTLSSCHDFYKHNLRQCYCHLCQYCFLDGSVICDSDGVSYCDGNVLYIFSRHDDAVPYDYHYRHLVAPS